MTFIIGLLTAILVGISAALILLVLIQLPKKEAGAGVAFGAGATDALFGSGSGNALTKMTRHTTIAFLALSLVLSILITRQHHPTSSGFGSGVDKAAAAVQSEAQKAAAPGTSLPAVTPAAASNAATPPAAPAPAVEQPLPATATNK
jgi:preprotein translocase subunit SecG